MSSGSAVPPADAFLAGSGEMRARMRALDWSKTPFGPLRDWPETLRIAASILLASRHGMIIWWGPQLAMLYNDAFSVYAGPSKHPRGLGRPGQEVYPEIWDEIGSRLDRVMQTGEATYDDDQLLVIDRAGYPEETYWTYSYSPIRAADASVAGVFTATTDTTPKVISARREAVLRALATHTKTTNTEEACVAAAKTLADARHDAPFALLYLRDGGDDRLAGASGVRADSPLAAASAWPLDEIVRSGQGRFMTLPEAVRGEAPGGAWPEPARAAFVTPIPALSGRDPVGTLVLGISPRRAFDESYRAFAEAVAQHVGHAVAAARAYESEAERAKALAELDRAKTTFFSNISHEFRTPLTLMLGPLSDALHSEDKSLPPESLESVHRNGVRLLKLVNALLDFSRIEAGRTQASLERLDLAAHTRDLASVFRSAIEKAGLEYDVDIEPVGEVPVDPAMWEKIVLNLLSNAFKHTFEGAIRVRLYPDGDSVRLDVSDTGIGIPDDQQANVFKRFYRVENARARSHEGSGIGLALVKELVALHQGQVFFVSQPNEGSTFTVRIPRQAAGAKVVPHARVIERRTDARAYVAEAVEPARAPELAARLAADRVLPDHPRGARVLIVDDNADMRDYLARILGQHWSVELAPDGEAAWAAIQARRPDLVLTDAMMPRLDGFGLVKRIRSDWGTRELPIIMLSARAGSEASVEGLQSGADDYLVKPFSAPELVARVEVNLERLRLRREIDERVREIIESVTERCIALDHSGKVTYQNQRSKDAVAAALGNSGDLVGRNIRDVRPPLLGEPIEQRLREVTASGAPAHFETHDAATDAWTEVNVYPTSSGCVLYMRDITGRKRTEEELRRSESRKAAILEGALDSVITIDHAGRVLEFNPAAERTFGYTREEALGQSMGELIVPPEFRARHEAGLAHYVETREGPVLGQRLRLPAMRRDGSTFPAELAIVRIPGEPLTFTGYLRDLTNEKRAEAELELARQRAAQSEKLSALGQLVSGVAHEVRTPLTYLSTNLYLIETAARRLAEELPSERAPAALERLVPRLEEANESVARIDRIVEDLRRFTKLETQHKGLARLDQVAAEAFRLFRATNKSGVHVDARLQPTPTALLDALQFQQVLLNLLQNAVEASAVDAPVLLETTSDPEGAHAILIVRDHGIGMAPAVLARIFDPLYTTKPAGTGLGLSIVKRIVEDHHGRIDIESVVGEGTTVTLRIPAARPSRPDP